MTRILSSFVVTLLLTSSEAFAPQPHQSVGRHCQSSTTALNGLFDFFSEEARKEREERKQQEIEEQERLQRQILERRSNPEKMEEYEARVNVRRRAIMNGADPNLVKVMVDDDEE